MLTKQLLIFFNSQFLFPIESYIIDYRFQSAFTLIISLGMTCLEISTTL